MSGLGIIGDPWDLATALNASEIETTFKTGRTLYLRAGTYSGEFTHFLDGASGRSIVVRPYPAEAAKVDGSIICQGTYTTFRDLEIFYTGWTARENADENSPNDIAAYGDLNFRAPYSKFINCIIHDMTSPYIGQEAVGAEFYGCVLYHNGWLAPIRGHGHGLYVQNSEATQMLIKDCILHNCFGWGLHAYAGNGALLLKNIVMEGNTCFQSGSLSGTARPDILLGGDSGQSTGCSIKSNMTYGGSVGVSFYEAGAALQDFTNNYCPNDKNQAWGGYTAVNESGNYWGSAIGNEVFLRANTYDANRANLTIYNQAAANTIDVDVSSVFGSSGTVKAYNVQDYFTDIQTLTITAGVITVNMQAANRTVATPVGWVAPAKTFPQFGAFVLVKQ
jgi:hypothetical protein